MRSFYGKVKAGQLLSDFGFSVNDLITYDSTQESTGGTIYRIVEDQPPAKSHTTQRKVVRERRESQRYMGPGMVSTSEPLKMIKEEITEYGDWDADGKALTPGKIRGYVRIKPIFQFLPTARGARPKGKSGTLMIYYDMLRQLKKVDIVALGGKYVELGNILKDVMRYGGAELSEDVVAINEP